MINSAASWVTQTSRSAYQMSIDHPKTTVAVKIVLGAGVGKLCAMHSTAYAIILISVTFFLLAKLIASSLANIAAIRARIEVLIAETKALRAVIADWDDAKVHAQPFLTPQMSESEKDYIAVCIHKFLKIERAGVVSQAAHLILPEMDGRERTVIFEKLTKMNVEHVEAFTSVIRQFMQELHLAGGELIDHQFVTIHHFSLFRPEDWAPRMEMLLPQLPEVIALIPQLNFEAWLFAALRKPLIIQPQLPLAIDRVGAAPAA